jgi:hypothetical protein
MEKKVPGVPKVPRVLKVGFILTLSTPNSRSLQTYITKGIIAFLAAG